MSGGRSPLLSSLLMLVALAGLVLGSSASWAQIDVQRKVPCCDLYGTTGVVWVGEDSLMTFERLASYCAPALEFSPDEPLLRDIKDRSKIDMPTAFPFEKKPSGPVVHYKVRTLLTDKEGEVYRRVPGDLNDSVIDLSKVSGADLDFFFYYPQEEGLGRHRHDVESAEMKIAIVRQTDCEKCRFAILIHRVTAKAHGILWYDNTLTLNRDTILPIHLFVEEGKHASCTDQNADGYYMPGYDVNERVNDAWGVRDIMRTGAIYTGGYQGWQTKVRRPEDMVYPPLPPDSPAYSQWVVDGVYAKGHAVYSLRPFPTVEAAQAYADSSGDKAIMRFVRKGHYDWPEVLADSDLRAVGRWMDEENFVKSLSISLRVDNDVGISFIFPLFIVKNFNDPISGGWLVNRIYFKDQGLRDFGWNILFTPSASRWIDSYFSAGLETDHEISKTYFATEFGVKLRFIVEESPLKFLKPITDFWGIRLGIRYLGYNSFSDLGYVMEFGAGTF